MKKEDSIKTHKELKDKELKKLKEQNIPEKLKILLEKGVEKLKEQNIPEKLNNLKDKEMEVAKDVYNKNKSTDTDWIDAVFSIGLGAVFIFSLYSCVDNSDVESDDDSDVKIIQQYDCPDVWGQHRLCGIVENKRSTSKMVFIRVNYYDADGVKLYDILDTIDIDPHGKSKFTTTPYIEDEPFDHYEVEL